ncbi:hypothetical protein [Thermoanaerobacterium butyriciformans]|uniref:hypothetical protein n=1 Tax=Thermoanaerobacterium butyriciformans TaxID=1702242 RepID=UPI001FD9D500|nr:hypothetical protein [Thermoanaerobacterium butyriciformans]
MLKPKSFAPIKAIKIHMCAAVPSIINEELTFQTSKLHSTYHQQQWRFSSSS